MLAIGLVLLTMVAVAVVAHAIVPELPWSAAFVLQRDRLAHRPDRGDGDHAAVGCAASRRGDRRGREPRQRRDRLVAYRFAVVAVVSGTFTLWEAGLAFVLNVAGGVAVGLGVAWIVRQVRRGSNTRLRR